MAHGPWAMSIPQACSQSVTPAEINANSESFCPSWEPPGIQNADGKGGNIKADSTLRCSQAVPHPSTNRALRRLTSEVGRDPVHSTRYGRRRKLTYPTPVATVGLKITRPLSSTYLARFGFLVERTSVCVLKKSRLFLCTRFMPLNKAYYALCLPTV